MANFPLFSKLDTYEELPSLKSVCAWVDMTFGSEDGDGGLVVSCLLLSSTEPPLLGMGEGVYDAKNGALRDDCWRLREGMVRGRARWRYLLVESILAQTSRALAASPVSHPVKSFQKTLSRRSLRSFIIHYIRPRSRT